MLSDLARLKRRANGQFWALIRRAADPAAEHYGALTGRAGSELFAHGGLVAQGSVHDGVFAHDAVLVHAGGDF